MNMPRRGCGVNRAGGSNEGVEDGCRCCIGSSPLALACTNRDREEAAAAAAVLSLFSAVAVSPSLSSLLAWADNDEMDEHMRDRSSPT